MLLRTLLIVSVFLINGLSYGQDLDFSNAVIIPHGNSERLQKYATILHEELTKRVEKTFPIQTKAKRTQSSILLTQFEDIPSLPKNWRKLLNEVQPMPDEGFKVIIDNTSTNPNAIIIGQDDRGLLFGIGHLLRKMNWAKDQLLLSKSIEKSSSPKSPIRGHQLGYRPRLMLMMPLQWIVLTNTLESWHSLVPIVLKLCLHERMMTLPPVT